MSVKASKVLSVAAKELGNYYPRPNGKSKYGLWYEKKKGVKGFATAPWCAMFVSWCADQAGATDIIPIHAYTPSGADWFKKRKQWHTRGGQPGDIVYFKFSGNRIHHVGIVEKANSNGTYTVIEGNTSGTVNGDQRNGGVVARKIRKSGIVGFGRPKYAPENPPVRVDLVEVDVQTVTIKKKTGNRIEPRENSSAPTKAEVGTKHKINAFAKNSAEGTIWLRKTDGNYLRASSVVFPGVKGKYKVTADTTTERFLPTRKSTFGRAFKKDTTFDVIGSAKESGGLKETWLIQPTLRFVLSTRAAVVEPVKDPVAVVVTQNCASRKPGWDSRVGILADVLLSTEADFICAQELYAELRPDLEAKLAPTYKVAAVREGRVIFYKVDKWKPLGSSFWQNLGVGGRKKPVVVRKFESIFGGHRLDIANVHLSYEISAVGAKNRKEEVKNVVAILDKKFAGDVNIVAGDFNAPAGGTTRPDDVLPGMVAVGYKDLGQEGKPKNGRGEYHLDRVFGPRDETKNVKTKLFKHKGSDHTAAVAVAFSFKSDAKS